MPNRIHARPLTLTLGIPGTERTHEHPHQAAAPTVLPAGDPALRPRGAREPDVAEVLRVSGRATADAPSNMERPGASGLRRRFAAHAPAGLRPSVAPAPMSSLLTGETSGAVVPLGPGQDRGGLHPGRTAVDDRFDRRLNEALDGLEAAGRAHAGALDGPTHQALQGAAESLDAALSASHSRNLAAAARMHTATRVRRDFAAEELDRAGRHLPAEDATPAQEALRQTLHRELPAVTAAARDAGAVQALHDAALNNAEGRLLGLMSQHPPGFAGTTASAAADGPDSPAQAALQALGAQLRAMAGRLPDQPLKEAMSRSGMVETVSRLLAHVTGGDAPRAANALQALMQAPATSWMSPPAADAGQAEADVRALFRQMSGVHRGTEVLMLAASPDGGTVAGMSARSLDLRAFWRADQALTTETSAPVRAWLEGAQRAAVISLESGADAVTSQRDLAALRAVRMGFVSNAEDSPYGRINKRLTKMVTQWVDRAQAPETGLLDRVRQSLGGGTAPSGDIEQGRTAAAQPSGRDDPPTLNPLGKKTPLRPSLQARLDRVGESVGVRTPTAPSSAQDARQRFADDLCAKLDDWDLRSRLRAADGGVVGAGWPSNQSISVPAAGAPLITPVAGYQRRREAFIDIFHPMQGLQITAGSIRHQAGELGASAGPSFKLAKDVLGLRVSGGAKAGGSDTHVEGAILRIRREAGRLPEMKDNLKQVVRDLAQWDALRDEQGAPFNDAVAALLARHEKLIVSDMTQDTSVFALEASASVGLAAGHPHKDQRHVTAGPNASVQFSTERQQQSYADNSGHVRVLNEQVSVAHHKLRASASLTANVGDPGGYPRAPQAASSASGGGAPAPSPEAAQPSGTAQVTGFKLPLGVGATREFGQDYERTSMTVLDFAGTIDADHDRFYNSPQPLVAEVELNREQWVQRYLETLTGWTEAQKQTQGRDLAHRDLDAFLDQARALQSSNYAQYNIHDTMMPQAAGHFETLYMLADVAAVSGNAAMAQAVKADRDQLLNEPSTWRRSTMNLFERGRSSAVNGINHVVRYGRTETADAQLQIAEYPSRNPAPAPRE